ncbi:hypothetical protein [Chryseobacterium pennipullorum]|uniref:Uncharacterized protein n=1 Tax=Chryseobacterium pennipullorum TaxID=2258963 RepID=A0A3D9AVQ1_9FLAO|nr:hypothetical protein [Chryseobacterium pennipullorum]REC45401.1 hypothetical protein DRF67_15780 [Chryseobacterium pennipullorum]
MRGQDFLDLLAEDTQMMGKKLAERVADQLQRGNLLGFHHRDYCGMAMGMNAEQHFLYGEFYDGTDFSVPQIFKSKDAFVAWLASQSTASLARLDAEDFYKGNQVITRERLLEFVMG